MMDDAGLLRHLDTLQPFWEATRDILLHEARSVDAGGIALHGDGAAADVGQHEGRDLLVVSGKLTLGDAVGWEKHLFRMGDQAVSLTTSRADLSRRTPRKRGWRILPWPVHSMNATWTTTSGRTQCALRGRPSALVKGGEGISSLSRR